MFVDLMAMSFVPSCLTDVPITAFDVSLDIAIYNFCCLFVVQHVLIFRGIYSSMHEERTVTVTYLSHSCFEVKDDNRTLLVDPFFTSNRLAPPYGGKPDIVLVTHEHSDHSDAGKFAAMVIAPPPLKRKFSEMTILEVGKSALVKGIAIEMISASHPMSRYPGGYIFTMGGLRFAHLGDTYLRGVHPLADIDVLFIPIGGLLTMNINKAVKALDRIKPRVAIPMHFNTFGAIRADPQQFKRKAEAAGHLVTVIPIGGSITVNARGE